MTQPATRVCYALCILGAAAALVGGSALLLETMREVGRSAVAAEADVAPRPSARSSSKWRCSQCGRIATRRDVRADGNTDPATRVEYTVRMADGSTRTFQEPVAVSWRVG